MDTVDKSMENTGEPVYITWDPPKDPNLLIVNYQIERLSDVDKGYKSLSCVTAKEFNAANHR